MSSSPRPNVHSPPPTASPWPSAVEQPLPLSHMRRSVVQQLTMKEKRVHLLI